MPAVVGVKVIEDNGQQTEGITVLAVVSRAPLTFSLCTPGLQCLWSSSLLCLKCFFLSFYILYLLSDSRPVVHLSIRPANGGQSARCCYPIGTAAVLGNR